MYEPKIITNRLDSQQNKLFSKFESNPVYYIIKEIKLFSFFVRITPNTLTQVPQELFSISENNLKAVGRILYNDELRRVAFFFMDQGASTARIVENRLQVPEATVYRHIKTLKNCKFIVPFIKTRKTKNAKGGPRSDVWGIPEASRDQILDAQKIHWRLESPKYVAGEKLGQLILEEYLLPRDQKELSRREFLDLTVQYGYKGQPDVKDFAANFLHEKGIKVYR